MPSNHSFNPLPPQSASHKRQSAVRNSFFLLAALLLLVALPVTASDDASRLLTQGQQAPICRLQAIDDTEQLFPLPGSWNMVFFWSLFCHSCIEEMPEIQARLAEYSPDQLQAFFVSLDTARMQKALLNFCRLRNLNHKVLMERIASDTWEVADQWGVVMTPTAFIVAPDGKVARSHQGPLDIEKFFADFAELLASSPNSLTTEGN